MYLNIIRLEHLFGEGNRILLAELLAGAEVNVDLAIFWPCVHTDMTLSNHHKARHTGIQWIRRLDIVQVNGTDLLHANIPRILIPQAPDQRLVGQYPTAAA